MAYAALTSLAGVIHQILPHDQKYVSLCRKDLMKSLHEKVCLLQEFLEYVSSRSFLPDIDALETRIRDTAYKLEDTIELAILTEPGKESETPDEFCGYFEEVSAVLEDAMEMKKTLDSNVIPLSNHPTLSREAPGSKGIKVGLEKALNQILDQVTRQGSSLRIVPITGMGGIGKTTLARASYEAPQALHHFDVRCWVTVSQEYDIQEILRGLLPEAKQTGEQLIEHVHRYLTGRRYLIVLDDMWDEKVWDRVRIAFPDNNKGSRVILTTRSSRVASYVGSSSPVHEMEFLSEDQSWDLLRAKVYGHECCSTEFESIGRTIAKNCKGLPLAVVVIAGLLKFTKTRYYWEQVARNIKEKATTSNDQLFEILSWSYTRLPPHLKACFLYIGVYGEDRTIRTKELVRLWAAEGFLKPKQSSSMEEVAEECLEELVERSLVLVKNRNFHNGKIETCSVHDVIREVSIRKAEEEKFLYHFTSYTLDESTFMNVLAVQRRLSITTCKIKGDFPRICDTLFATPRSLIDQWGNLPMTVVQCFKLLRVLNVVLIEKDSMLSILFSLTNLRYLHFVCLKHDKPILVPESISKLQNLETLIVSPRNRFFKTSFVFPLEIWKLQRLRHIIVGKKNSEFPVPEPNQDCPSLQTLSRLGCVNFTKSFIERIPNLKKLKLKYTKGQEYSMDNLQYLHQLEKLSIFCDFDKSDDRPPPTNYVFPQNLKKLSLYRTKMPLENLSRIGLLSNLKVLKLKALSVGGWEWEPNEGEFLQLEHLKMENISISHWRAESIHFPRLRKLEISSHCLKEVPESIGEIDTLETLNVKLGSEEARRSVQKIKENQQDMGNDLLQVIILNYWS